LAARQRHLHPANRLDQRAPGLAGESVRALTGEQLVEDDSERVDVGGDAHSLSADLLRRGVVGGERRTQLAGQLRVAGPFLAEELRCTEVEQAEALRLRDQDVARLEVRCTTRCACAYDTAAATSRKSSRRSRSESRAAEAWRSMGTPSTSSIAR